jgi:hypothetical protein
MVGLVLLAAGANLPRQGEFVRLAWPVIRLWPDLEGQRRLQLGDVPYDLLRAADAVLPPEAGVLLVTPGHDVRGLDYQTFHRALYFLAPRPVWWVTPAPADGTWESRWWLAQPLTPHSLQVVAGQKKAACLLSLDLSAPRPEGEVVAQWSAGYLLQMAAGACHRPGRPMPGPENAGSLWPLQSLTALLIIAWSGFVVLALMARSGYQLGCSEAAVLAWPLGAGVTSLGMWWLNSAGLSLKGQVCLLSLVTVAGLFGGWRQWRNTSQRRQNGSPQRAALALAFSLTRLVMTLLLLLLLGVQIAYVTLLAVTRPLFIWDSWVTWGMKARAIFLAGGISPAVYADPARAVTHLDYPLLLPLIEAWLFRWLGAPDDRLVGWVSVFFYLSLIGLCYAAARRWGADRLWALAVATAVAVMPHIAGLSATVFADVPLALYLATAAVYLVAWLEEGKPATLVIAALAAGLLPWTKREGWLLFGLLCLAVLWIGRQSGGRQSGGRHSGRAWLTVAALGLSACCLAAPWWLFVARHHIANTDFLPLTPATFLANLDRLPTVAWLAGKNLLSSEWSFAWPLAVLFGLYKGWLGGMTRGSIALLPMVILLYLGLAALGYIFSAYVPYQQHVINSFFRLASHVAPLAVLWLGYYASGER